MTLRAGTHALAAQPLGLVAGTTAALAVLGVRVWWAAARSPGRGGHARRRAPAAP